MQKHGDGCKLRRDDVKKMEMQSVMVHQDAQKAGMDEADAARADSIVTAKFIQKVRGRCVAIAGNDVDTDRIAPARFLKAITFEGFGKVAFLDERFASDGSTKGHPFDLQRHEGASILLANRNFGCGSSREHAPQALMRWGIRAIVAESFASIFADNCTAIGMPTLTVTHSQMEEMMALCEENPEAEAVVSLERMQVEYCSRKSAFKQDSSQRSAFLCGRWDSLSELMEAKQQVEKVAQAIEGQKQLRNSKKTCSCAADKPKVENGPNSLLEYGRSVR